MTITVGKLKELLYEVLQRLEDYEEDRELKLQPNSYFTRHNNCVLQTRNGFLGLDDLEEAIGKDVEGDDE
jgi:hypothetical protein